MPYKQHHDKQRYDREYRWRMYNPNNEGDHLCILCMRRFRSFSGLVGHEKWHEREEGSATP